MAQYAIIWMTFVSLFYYILSSLPKDHSLSLLSTCWTSVDDNLYVMHDYPKPLRDDTNFGITDTVGEIWLIRHAEKDIWNGNDTDTLYDLSNTGWQRAQYLRELVEGSIWPPFSALFASAYASHEEILNALPDVVRDSSGQSMVRREYQTLLPMAQYLGIGVDVTFAKTDRDMLALAAARVAVASDAPVLISWDHCSAPTLISHSFACE